MAVGTNLAKETNLKDMDDGTNSQKGNISNSGQKVTHLVVVQKV